MTFGIVGNYKYSKVAEAIANLIQKLTAENIQFCVDDNARFVLPGNIDKSIYCSESKLIESSDYIISFGGDGTMLWTAKLVGASGKPILGVNLGKLGFLTEASTENIFDFVHDTINNKLIIEERSVIQAEIEGYSTILYGLNEIVISKDTHVKTIEIIVYHNDEPVISYNADGLIICTPTGSTGYSLSAGGPIVNPDSNVFIISPICPHSLTARPIVVPDNGIIKAVVHSKVPVIITSDGNFDSIIENDAVIYLSKATYKIRLLRRKTSSFYEIINKKLLFGEDIRKKVNNKT